MSKMDFIKPNCPNDRLETQYKIRKEGTDTYRTCWLDRNELKPGMRVRFRGEDDWYVIIEKYSTMRAEILDMNRNPDWFSVEKSGEPVIIY